jgi:hypothetical protein
MSKASRKLARYQGPAARTLAAANPPGLSHARPGGPIFDAAPHRNRGMIPAPEVAAPLLNRMIATCVAFGMPPAEAAEARRNPYVRAHLIMLTCMIWDANEGNVRAKAALDRISHAFNHRLDVAEVLSAFEQPANPAELQSLLGADQ